MSAIITGKVFWTPFKDLSYKDKAGKQITIKETTAKIVMLAIADSSDDYGENSWNSFETLAKKSSIQRRSVIRVIRALLEHKYLTVAGVTQYGTNNFSVNKDMLGCPPAKRSKVGRPKTGDLEIKIGDSEAGGSDSDAENGDLGAKTGDQPSPDPLINPPLNPSINPSLTPPSDFFQNASLEWKLTHGLEVTDQDFEQHKEKDEAPKMFERAFGFGTLPWGSNRAWEKFQKFVTDIYSKDRLAFGNYVVWRGDKGKYKAMSNKQIRMNPQIFMDTGWAEFVATTAGTLEKPDNRSKYFTGDYAEFIEH